MCVMHAWIDELQTGQARHGQDMGCTSPLGSKTMLAAAAAVAVLVRAVAVLRIMVRMMMLCTYLVPPQ